MGFSCTKAAGDKMRELMRRHQHGKSTNEFSTDNGKTVFFADLPTQQRDGSVRGEVYRMTSDGNCTNAGRYHIAAMGTVIQFDGLPPRYWADYEDITPAQRRRNWAALGVSS